MRNLIFFICFLVCLSCSTTKNVSDTSHELIKIDTIYQRLVDYDSIYIYNDRNVYLNGDTVFVEATKIEYRNKIKIDTLYKTNIEYKTDSIYFEKTIEVPRKRNWFDWVGYYSFIVLFVWLLFKILKR